MEQIDGYINRIQINGKVYSLRCEIVEIYPITCPKCGASFELKYGNGQCVHCGTHYTTQFKLIPSSLNGLKQKSTKL